MIDLVALRQRLWIVSALIVSMSFLGYPGRAQSPENVRRVGAPPPAGAPVQDIEMSAKKYEFAPRRVEVPISTLVRIHLSATDREHGFELKDVKGSCVTYKPGAPVTVEFFVDRSGEWEFRCCKFCGLGHGKMKGVLVVKAAAGNG